MKLAIVEERKSPLLAREEIKVKVSFQGATPKREDIKQAIAKEKKAVAENVLVNTVRNIVGTSEVVVDACIYENKEALEKLEKEKIIKKNTPPAPESEE